MPPAALATLAVGLALCAGAPGATSKDGARPTAGELAAIKAMEGGGSVQGDMVPPVSTNRGSYTNVQKWPQGKVYYVIDNWFSNWQRGKILESMKHIEQRSCVKFVPRTNERNYIRIHKSKGDVCFATIGMSGWPGQDVNLGNSCFLGNIGVPVHELMHALGFMHEQQRPDRDQYVEVLWNNVQPNMKSNFNKNNWAVTDTSGTAYDTLSLMHYPTNLFGIGGRHTLRSLTGAQLTQYVGLTATDVYELNKVYGCDMSGVPTDGVKFADGGGTGGNKKPAKNNNGKGNEKCKDAHGNCPFWSRIGECERNAAWMRPHCAKSCRRC